MNSRREFGMRPTESQEPRPGFERVNNEASPNSVNVDKEQKFREENIDDTVEDANIKNRSIDESVHMLEQINDAPQMEYGFDIVDRPYVVDKKIGEGGFGQVFLAHEKKHYPSLDEEMDGQDVVIKIMKPTLFKDAKARDMFQSEIDSHIEGGKLSPYVVPVIDKVSVENPDTRESSIGLVMQYMEDGSVEELFHRAYETHGTYQLPEQVIASIALQTCKALQGIHDAGYVHGDIKPHNIFVDAKAGVVKLGDFGLCQAIEAMQDNSPSSNKENERAFVGTLGYLSPDSFYTDAKVTPDRDMYALGAMLYEMRAGKIPFAEEYAVSNESGILAHAGKEVESIKNVLNDTYEFSFLDPLIETLLRLDKKNRHRFYDAEGDREYEINSVADIAQAIENMAAYFEVSLDANNLQEYVSNTDDRKERITAETDIQPMCIDDIYSEVEQDEEEKKKLGTAETQMASTTSKVPPSVPGKIASWFKRVFGRS